MSGENRARVDILRQKLKPPNQAHPEIRRFIERWKSAYPDNDNILDSQLGELGLPELKPYLVWFRLDQMQGIERLESGSTGDVKKATVKHYRYHLGEVVMKRTNVPEVGIQLRIYSRLYLNVICVSANSTGYFTVPVLGLSENERGESFMVMGIADLGTLDDIRYNNWWQFVEMAQYLAACLACLHNAGLIHGDLHPKNIALMADITRPRFIDLGLGRAVEENFQLSSHFPNTEYSPPELSSDHPTLTRESDVYTFAMVLWKVIVQKAPSDDLIKKIRDGDYPLPEPKDFFDILKGCWSLNPADRPNSHKVYELLQNWRENLAKTLPKFWPFTKRKNILFTRFDRATKQYINQAKETNSEGSSFGYPPSDMGATQESTRGSFQNVADENELGISGER
ncbi:kinase-like domain-containing protein [Jimgerdemannia flammicorona]|uniref:Kinase-like domain-containing protein n=1 Tax=Jimgerdemannia flammicorona TaxID=994334 RepID=A0A433CXZ5_9FUNG|nr:kinase-like domain-containing protein [Jimgerdemannia flammicorona]